jgi:hypothetical protein
LSQIDYIDLHDILRTDVEKSLECINNSLNVIEADYQKGLELCAEAIKGIHTRLERIEKWLLQDQGLKIPTTNAKSAIPKKRSNR